MRSDSTGPRHAGDEAGLRHHGEGVVWWLPVVIMAILPLLLLRSTLGPIRDPDAFWHIRAGEHLWSTWSFTAPEPWSSFSVNDWVLHEWLPELVYAKVVHLGGLAGLAWVHTLLCLSLLVVIYLCCRLWATPLIAGVVTGAAWVGMSDSLSPRPQVMTFLFLLISTQAWLRTADDHRPRWWLIPLAWIWACSHGMWIVGPITGMAVVAGMLLEGTVAQRRALMLALIPCLSVAAAALTPVGPRLLLAPLEVRGYARYVTEWASPVLTEVPVATTVLLAIIVFAGWGRSGRAVPWPHLALAVVALGWSMLYSRTVPLGAVMLAPLAAATLQRLLADGRDPVTGVERRAVTAGLVVALGVGAVLAPRTSAEPASVPSGLDTLLARMPSGTVVFNEYDLGGWLLWRHRQLVPIIDGRTEVYGHEHLGSYMRARAVLPEWDATVTESKASIALLRRSSALEEALTQRLGWARVTTDNGFVLLRAPSG